MANTKIVTTWYGAGHPAESRTCPTCNAPDGTPCVSVVPSFGYGAIGATLRGLHAARVALTVPAPALTDNASTERAA